MQNLNNCVSIAQDDLDPAPTPLLMARLGELAYLKSGTSETESPLNGALIGLGFKCELIGASADTDTQFFIASNGTYRVLVFRGTEANPTDVVTDAKATLLEENGKLFHAGFLTAFKSVQNEIEKALHELSPLPLFVTGHSLGGALAAIAAYYFRERVIGGYTFGAPPIGVGDFLDSQRDGFCAFVNEGDIVPRVMQVGPAPATLAWLIIQLLVWICSIFRWRAETLKAHAVYLKDLIPIFGKYSQCWPTIIVHDDRTQETLVSNESSFQLFLKILGKNWKRSFSDHGIATYISRLSPHTDSPAEIEEMVPDSQAEATGSPIITQ